jgi:hypothetical protein
VVFVCRVLDTLGKGLGGVVIHNFDVELLDSACMMA